MTQTTALDELIEDARINARTRRRPLDDHLRVYRTFSTTTFSRALQDPRYIAYCKERDGLEFTARRNEFFCGPVENREVIKGEVGLEVVYWNHTRDAALYESSLGMMNVEGCFTGPQTMMPVPLTPHTINWPGAIEWPEDDNWWPDEEFTPDITP